MTSQRLLIALLVLGALGDSARPVPIDERQLRLAEVPSLLLARGATT